MTAMSPDHAWCSHSEPSARRWYSLVSNLRLAVDTSCWIAFWAAVISAGFSVLTSVTPLCSRPAVRPSCWSSSMPTLPLILGPSIHSADHGSDILAGLKPGSLSVRQPIPVV